MARILVTGSSTGLGLMAGALLAGRGHRVTLHARDAARAEDARRALPQAEAVIAGDLARLAGARAVAEQANRLGRFDAIIHNAGIGYGDGRLTRTPEGLPEIFAVNVLAPYVMTALIERPKRLVYLSSGMHRGASLDLDDLGWRQRRWSAGGAYGESKLLDVLLAFALARRWPDVFSNAVDPGWVATRMGGANAPDSAEDGRATQAWLAVSEDKAAKVSGKYFHHLRERAPDAKALSVALQDRLIAQCEKLSGVALPA
ncbi:MAG: SDR family NAD(P)-dependent oxidoreductase [Bradyrhizobium sp.]|nr:MAG: SDR family NAD(P)-dependent oxidoreductase [Bradyrhizobium sp.]